MKLQDLLMILSSIYERISRKESLLMEGLNSSLSLLLAKHCWKGFGQTFADHGWATCWLRAVSAVVEGWAYGASWPGGVRRVARRESWWHSPNAFGKRLHLLMLSPCAGAEVGWRHVSRANIEHKVKLLLEDMVFLSTWRFILLQNYEFPLSSDLMIRSGVFVSCHSDTISSVAIPKAWESEHAIKSPSFWICGYLQEFCSFFFWAGRAMSIVFVSSFHFAHLNPGHSTVFPMYSRSFRMF